MLEPTRLLHVAREQDPARAHRRARRPRRRGAVLLLGRVGLRDGPDPDDGRRPDRVSVVPASGAPAHILRRGMRVGVARETAAGERRVALVPDAAARLSAAGIELVVEAARAAAPRSSTSLRGGGRGDRSRCGRPLRRRRPGRARCRSPRPARSGSSAPARRSSAFLQPLVNTDLVPRDRRTRRDRVLDGRDPADHAGTVHGRALLAGDGGGLQGSAARRRVPAALRPDADDGRRHDPAGEGARSRRRRRRAAGDRDRAAPRARSSPPSTRGRWYASRSRASARPSSSSRSRATRPRAATRRSSPRSSTRASSS